MYLILSPFVVIVVAQLSTFSAQGLHDLWDHLKFNLIYVILFSSPLAFCTLCFLTRPRPVYLMDFSCYKPEDARKCTRQIFMERSQLIGTFTEQSLDFQRKILERSGLGDSTYLPEAVIRVPPNPCIVEARKDAEAVMFSAVDQLFAKALKENLRYLNSSYCRILPLIEMHVTMNCTHPNHNSIQDQLRY